MGKLTANANAYDVTDQNSWWGRSNQSALDYDRSNLGGPSTIFEPVRFDPLSKPADWDEFRNTFGSGYANTDDYNNWSRQKARFNTVSAFADQMNKSDPTVANFTSQMGQDYGQYKGYLDDWYNAPRPQVSNDNRFEAGLSANERRLNALLDDPEAIRQTAAYKFRLKQGEDALQRQLGAKGLLASGNRLQALTQYGQDMASQEYDAQAKRLSDLVGAYGTNWIGDKNANTQRYAAESTAWNQRGGVLADILNNAGNNYVNAQKIGADQRLGWAALANEMIGKPFQKFDNGSSAHWNWG